LINNAGVGCSGNVGELPLEDWQWIISINLNGAIYGCHTMIDWMKHNPRGAHIVNVASMAAVVSAPGMAPYNVTKAGMVSLSETLSGELKPHRIAVTAVLPAFFPTNILENGRYHKANQRRVANTLMSHSHVSAEEVARKVLRAVERKQLYVFAPGVAGLFWRLKRMMPRALLRFVANSYHARLAKAAEDERELARERH
jgi:short-subunit dehydrogenase